MGLKSVRNKICAGEAIGATELDLRQEDLETLPPEIGRLTALMSLDLGDNRLETLPPEIGRLTVLASLELGGNRFKTLPPEIVRLTALTSLDLDDNRLETLPPEIGRLTALTKLHLGNNRLETLPPEIGELIALTTLGLSENRLKTLPPEIGRLTALWLLDLNDNRLETLPPEIGRLTARTTLHLGNNRLETLPPEIGKLPDSAKIVPWGSPLVDPPVQIAARGPRAIREWFRLKALPPDAWVARSSLASVFLGRRSYLAVAETVAMMLLSAAAVTSGHDSYLWFWLAFTPFLLLRTEESVADGLAGYKWLVETLNIRDPQQSLPMLALRLVLLGIGSVAVKVATTAKHLLSARSWQAVPWNFTRSTRHVDMFSPAELVPGAEAAFATDPSRVFVFGDLGRNFTADPKSSGLYDKVPWIDRKAERVVAVFTLSIFFLFAWAYRFSIKATAVAYFPFLLFYRFDDEAQRRHFACRQAKEASWSKWPAPTAAGVLAAFAALALARINHIDWLESLIAELADNPMLGTMAALAAEHADKALITMLLAFSLFYIAGRLSLLGLKHALSARPEDQWKSVLDEGAAGTWYRIAAFFWTATNAVATLFCVMTFTIAVPFVWDRAGEICAFFF